ncbi:MAG: glycosyltransferase [Anaerolineaceae bacterium]|nr:glycosyltransferase [Anaerolineaceae bacterium]
MIKHLRFLTEFYLIKRSGLFDANYYLLNYPDVRKADVDPLMHYIKNGWKEGRNPSPTFNTHFYLHQYSEVTDAGTNPLVHYIKYGLKDGRRTQSGIINEILLNVDLTVFNNLPNNFSHILEEEFEHINELVSVIIPTKNAGNDFDFLLKMILNQKGFDEIEIIIVDSGSEDNTVQIAKNFGVKVIEILPSEFSHSYTRNLGAENALGDYLFFTVQDALPPTNTWLYELMTTLKNNDVTAVSCAEIPREDADLFYRVISWIHYNFLGVNKTDKIFKLPDTQNYLTLRQNGQLSDIACLIPRDIFMRYKYRLNYAEDLDLGIRLIKSGEKIAFLGSTRIIHSHNRPPFYYLKRGYVDNLFLTDMFSDLPVPNIYFDEFLSDIIFTFNYVNMEINEKFSMIKFPINNQVLADLFNGMFMITKYDGYPINTIVNCDFIDNNCKEFLESLLYNSEPVYKEKYIGLLVNSIKYFVNNMFEYLNICHENIDENLAEEIKASIFKAFFLLTGAHLAYCYKNNYPNENNYLEELHLFLKEGI